MKHSVAKSRSTSKDRGLSARIPCEKVVVPTDTTSANIGARMNSVKITTNAPSWVSKIRRPRNYEQLAQRLEVKFPARVIRGVQRYVMSL